MYVVRVISCCKETMTTNCFPLLLSSSFCPLFPFPYFSCCSVLRISFSPEFQRHWLAKQRGSCGGLAACGSPAALGSLTLSAEQVPSDSSRSQLQLGLLAGTLGLGRSQASLPQDFSCHLFCCL